MGTFRRCVTLPVAMALAFGAACDDGGGEPQPSTTEQSPAARARAINLALVDLPAEFVALPNDAEADENNVVQDCVGDIADAVVAEAETPLFQRPAGDGLHFVATNTAVLDDESAATELVAALQEQATVDCLRDTFAETLIEDSATASVEDSTLGDATDVPDVGEQTAALAGSLRFTPGGADRAVELDYTLVLVRTDTVVSFLLYGGVLEPFPPELHQELTALVAERQ